MVMVPDSCACWRACGCVFLALSMLVLTGCAHTRTQVITEDNTQININSWSAGGRILHRSATVSYEGENWNLRAGDGAKEVSADPETVKALAEGISAGVVQSLKRVGWLP